MYVCVEVLMFLGVRVHLYMGCVAARGSEKGFAVQLSPVQRKKTVIFEPLKTDRRADGYQKKTKGFPKYSLVLHKTEKACWCKFHKIHISEN